MLGPFFVEQVLNTSVRGARQVLGSASDYLEIQVLTDRFAHTAPLYSAVLYARMAYQENWLRR